MSEERRKASAALVVRGVRKTFAAARQEALVAVDGVDLEVAFGEFVGIVGESGCGKSTLVRMVVGLAEPDEGSIEVATRAERAKENPASCAQMVFQLPASSFDPRRTLLQSVAEPLRNAHFGRHEAFSRALDLLGQCGLDETIGASYPHQVSGGQCQRAAIARALAADPVLLVCDEATSALDITAQRRIVELLRGLKGLTNMACLFVSHDIALVHSLCDRVAVMDAGRIVEEGPVDEVVNRPRHACTRRLIEAVL